MQERDDQLEINFSIAVKTTLFYQQTMTQTMINSTQSTRYPYHDSSGTN
jgi:hypothetical protein